MVSDDETQMLLTKLYSARLESLKSIAIQNEISKKGSVEQLRARLIQNLILSEWKFDWSSIQSYSKQELTQFLSVFGIKRSGSIKGQRQRLWLHLNCDIKYHSLDNLDNLSRDELHDLCLHLELPRSGSKSQLFGRVAGVLSSQSGGWGQVKRSLRRPKGGKANIKIPIKETEAIEEVESIDDVVEVVENIIDNTSEIHEVPLITEIEDVGTVEQIQTNVELDLEEQVENFIKSISEKWGSKHESELFSHLSNLGFAVHLPEISSTIYGCIDTYFGMELGDSVEAIEFYAPINSAEEAQVIANLESRNAELDNAIRDFLDDGDPNDLADVNAFVKSLELQGMRVEMPIVRQQIIKRISEMQEKISVEKASLSSSPQNWREREALRKLERLRPHLLKKLEDIMRSNDENLVRARVEFESLASNEGLDLSISSISGRLHGLFDLHVELNAHLIREDPRTKRRERALAILNHNSIDLPESGRNTLLRLERNIEGFEQVIDVILRRNPGKFDEDQQILLIRFLEQRGYEANQESIRPRILGAAGMLAVDMGHISADQIPTLGPENLVAEAQVDSVISEIKRIVKNVQEERGAFFEEAEQEPVVPQHHVDKIKSMRNKMKLANDILDRIGGRGL